MDPFRSKARSTFNQTAVGTNAGATATEAAAPGLRHVAEFISGSGDAACTVKLKNGNTVIWQKRFAAAFTFSESLPPGVYIADVDAALSVVISASTANCEINLAGVSVAG